MLSFFGVENAENHLAVIQVKTLDVKKLFPFASDIEEVACIRAIGNVSWNHYGWKRP